MFTQSGFNCVKCVQFIQGQTYMGVWQLELVT